jgi:hypothetical protein
VAPLHQIECGITKGASTVGGLHPIGFGFGGTFGNTLTGADALLSGETDGMASDFTRSDGTGYVSVKDTVTPANDKSNVIGDLFWTNSGTSPKLINTSAGALAWSPHNMFLNSAAPATQNVTLIVGATYTVTVTGAGGGNITGSAGASGVATTGSPATFTATTTTGTFTYTATLTTIQLNRGSVATAYLATTGSQRFGLGIDYSGGSYGLLVEPAATNLALQSQDLSTTWTNTNTTETTNSTTAPDGTTTADTLTASSTTDCRIAQTTAARTDNAAHTTSVYAKKGTSNFLIVVDNYIADGTGSGAWFNLNTGVVGTKQANVTTSTITDVGNGWYRCSITGTNTSSTTQAITLYIADADNSLSVTNGNTIFLWGAQCEVGTVATSHIPTFAATVTRAADSVTAASTTFNLGTSYSVYHRSTILALGSGSLAVIAAVDNGTANERAVDYSEGGKWKYVVTDGGATQALQDTALTAPTLGTIFKAGWRASANSFNHAIDGVVDTVDAAGAMPTATTIRLGYTAISAGAQGPVRTHYVVHLPRAMTDLELDAATT